MSIPEVDPPFNAEAMAEARLQQELRSLFAVDTQNYLQRYSQIAEQLQADSWVSDIQELYRCIHTIKGGAVTVAAEAVLQVATALEDLLSDLRYLNPAPPLADGHLSQILLETGELLTGTLELLGSKEAITAQLEPILNRIQTLHNQVRERYLPTWNEQRQLHQEFAEQGFDMVILELEIALERSPAQGKVSEATLNIAQQTLAQLQQIGQDLQLASGWTTLLNQAESLFERLENATWRSQWLRIFQALKQCAKQGGQPVPFHFECTPGEYNVNEHNPNLDREVVSTTDFNLLDSDIPLHVTESLEFNHEFNLFKADLNTATSTNDFTEIGAFLDTISSIEGSNIEAYKDKDYTNEPPNFPNTVEKQSESNLEFTLESSHIGEFLDAIDRENIPDHTEDTSPEEVNLAAHPSSTHAVPPSAQPTSAQVSPVRLQRDHSTDLTEKVQIPVPLEKLDRSAQHLVETLLAIRTTRGFYQTLQNQITQLVALAQEGAQYITSLRQIQDDYALLDNLKRTQGPTPERYRQGYTTINRLLETSLRLSELGAEAEKIAQQTAESLQSVDNSLLKLQNTVEDSRLVPFQNLGFRARAILRDLITRYGKPARLVIQGEQIELDVSTIRSLEPALLHLIRNAYDHGLESPDDRTAQGKPEQGTISIGLQRRGNTFQLDVQDDGRGIEAKAIEDRAKTLKFPLTSTQTPAELLAVICQPGFSSETQVSDLSGRGVGMDVVAAQVARIGGKLSLETAPGIGTTFHLQFPVPHLLVPCLLLQAGQRVFALPTEDIRTTTLFETLNATPVETAIAPSWTIQDDAGSTPALDLLGYWQPRALLRSLPDTAVCLYVFPQNMAQGVWLVADELLGQSDLLISPLPAPLIAPAGLMGVSLQVDGTLVPVLEPAAIAERLLAAPMVEPDAVSIKPPPSEGQDPDESIPAILIVDDAALIRRRIEASLAAYGYSTHTCADGLEAWNWIQKHPHSTLIITDIEMPHMDGFTLIDRCRQAGIATPILVISSRLSEEWFSEAKRLGATDYLTKGFSTIELINKVNALIGAATSHSS